LVAATSASSEHLLWCSPPGCRNQLVACE
jgi:hypothetical protein